MKIYINNFDINKIHKIQPSLNDILVETKIYTELYTNESMYHIDCKNIFALESIDGDINEYKNYLNDISLTVDNSYFKKRLESSVNGNMHLHKKIKKNAYKLNAKSKLCLVIEMVDILENNAFVPTNVYFESNEITDIKELFIRQELIEFLSLLN